MKRFCSWIILLVFTYLSRLILGLIITLTSWIITKISNFSEVLYWLIILLYGGSILWFITFLFGAGASLVVNTVQSIHESKTGARYIVVAVLNVLFSAFLIYGYFVGFVTGTKLTMVAYGVHAIFTIVVAIMGKSAANKVKEREFQNKVAEYIERH